jgi:uncharacterized membrane protein
MFWKIYFIALSIFLFIDAIWLGLVAKNFYQKQIGPLMKDINWVSAFLVYALFILGLVVLVLLPGIKTKTMLEIVMLGGLLGLVCYGVYDLTNLATLKNWTLTVTIVDMAWGLVVGSLVSLFTYLIVVNFFKIN